MLVVFCDTVDPGSPYPYHRSRPSWILYSPMITLGMQQA